MSGPDARTTTRELPGFQSDGNLPSGIYRTTIGEIRAKLGWNDHRLRLIEGLSRAAASLGRSGVRWLWVAGSFVTSKAEPNDIDGFWEATYGMNARLLDPVFLDDTSPRQAMKDKYGVDFLIASPYMPQAKSEYCDFYRTDREGHSRGILMIELECGI